MIGYMLAVMAGLCAALASTLGKFAAAVSSAYQLCNSFYRILKDYHETEDLKEVDALLGLLPECDTAVTYLRLTCFVGMLILNGIMWTLFVKALQKTSSTVEATVFNTASNFFFTALLGRLFFGETLSLLWGAGASLIIIGLVIIHKSTPGLEAAPGKEKHQ